jgi:hypothetical protein
LSLGLSVTGVTVGESRATTLVGSKFFSFTSHSEKSRTTVKAPEMRLLFSVLLSSIGETGRQREGICLSQLVRIRERKHQTFTHYAQMII